MRGERVTRRVPCPRPSPGPGRACARWPPGYPACVLFYHKYIEHAACCRSFLACLPACKPVNARPGEKEDERASVRMLRDTVVPFVYKYRFYVLSLGLAVAIANASSLGALWRLNGETPGGEVPNHPFTRREDIETYSFFATDDWAYQMRIVYGLDPDRPVTYTEDGQLVRSSDRDTFVQYRHLSLTPDLQEALVDDCTDASNNKSLVRDKERYCILNELKKWNRNKFPYASEADLFNALTDFYDSDEYRDLVDDKPGFRTLTGFVRDGSKGIKAIWNSFNASIPCAGASPCLAHACDAHLGPARAPRPRRSSRRRAVTHRQSTTASVADTQPFYDLWTSYTEECAAPCFHYLPGGEGDVSWPIYSVLLVIVQEMYFSFIYAALAAFVVVTVSTGNVVLGCLVLVTIIMAVVSIIAMIFLNGGSIGIFEVRKRMRPGPGPLAPPGLTAHPARADPRPVRAAIRPCSAS